jgi:kinesin family protein 5
MYVFLKISSKYVFIFHVFAYGDRAVVFAYGQTSAGKTHTMQGPNVGDPDNKGLIPRACDEIFNSVYAADDNFEFSVKVGYIEIYMERIRDLLNPAEQNLQVREDVVRGIYVDKMHEEYVTSPDEMIQVMGYGAKNRAVAATGMNEGSSRSHSVFCVSVEQTDTRTEARKKGRLYLVDLAGSEMVGKTGAKGVQVDM